MLWFMASHNFFLKQIPLHYWHPKNELKIVLVLATVCCNFISAYFSIYSIIVLPSSVKIGLDVSVKCKYAEFTEFTSVNSRARGRHTLVHRVTWVSNKNLPSGLSRGEPASSSQVIQTSHKGRSENLGRNANFPVIYRRFRRGILRPNCLFPRGIYRG